MTIETSFKIILLFIGTLIPFTEEKKMCPFSEIVQLQRGLYKNTDQNYFPKESCFVCAKPSEDNRIKGSVERETSFGPIPLYNRMIEFGLLGIDFPIKAFLFIQINDKCFFKAQIKRDKIKNKGFLEFYICIDNYENCPKLYGKYIFKNFKYDSTCVFLSFWMEKATKIHYAASRGCFAPSTNVFKEQEIIDIKMKECNENPYTKFDATFIFEEEKKKFFDGISILMPCTPGGYSVDPMTGRFAIDEYCSRVFWYSKADPESGLDFIVKNFFNSTEDFKFPAPLKTAEESNYKPVFIGQDELPKSLEEMTPKIEVNKRMLGKVRKGCGITESEYKDKKSLNDTEGRSLVNFKDDQEKQKDKQGTVNQSMSGKEENAGNDTKSSEGLEGRSLGKFTDEQEKQKDQQATVNQSMSGKEQISGNGSFEDEQQKQKEQQTAVNQLTSGNEQNAVNGSFEDEQEKQKDKQPTTANQSTSGKEQNAGNGTFEDEQQKQKDEQTLNQSTSGKEQNAGNGSVEDEQQNQKDNQIAVGITTSGKEQISQNGEHGVSGEIDKNGEKIKMVKYFETTESGKNTENKENYKSVENAKNEFDGLRENEIFAPATPGFIDEEQKKKDEEMTENQSKDDTEKNGENGENYRNFKKDKNEYEDLGKHESEDFRTTIETEKEILDPEMRGFMGANAKNISTMEDPVNLDDPDPTPNQKSGRKINISGSGGASDASGDSGAENSLHCPFFAAKSTISCLLICLIWRCFFL
ncbi:UNVERIFIED_CONTAM: hypothetical protein RMT77_001110 [Armadillidium vulgare]